jgi:hypothetical protein
MAMAKRSGVAFAIPVNRVKDFLEQSGLDRVFPARRATLGALESFEGKGVRLRVPDAFEDLSRSRLRIEWRPPDEVGLRVDRVATPLTPSDLEGALLESRDLAGLVGGRVVSSRRDRLGGRPAALGTARGNGPDGAPLEMIYAVVDLAREKVVARYLGPPHHVAFNRSVFQASLASLEVDPLLVAEVSATVRPTLHPLALSAGPPEGPWPGWRVEPSSEVPCGELPPPDDVTGFSPAGDYTVNVRVSTWRSPSFSAEQALAACRGRERWFRLRVDRLGAASMLQGTFVAAPGALWRIELDVPVDKEAFVRDAFIAWAETLRPMEPR